MSLISKVKSRYVLAEANSKAVDQYLATMLWSTNDESTESGGEPMDSNYDVEDISDELVKASEKDIEEFYKKAEAKGIDLSKYDDSSIGHDFWLTRNGHGAGFWDGDYDDEDGEVLTEISKEFGELHPYVGDDGIIYV